MKYETRKAALTAIACQFSEAMAKRHKAVKSRYWSMKEWKWIPCWTVVMK